MTEIGVNAFSGCKEVKKITIQGKKLESIGKNAFKNIAKKAVFRVPESKVNAYKKLLSKKTGFQKTMKVKKK